MRTRLTAGFALTLALVALAGGEGAAQQPKNKAPLPQFQTAAQKYFSKWDKDRNGQLSIEEIDAVLTDPQVKGEAAAVAAVLRMAGTPSKKTDPALVINADFLGAPVAPGKASLDVRFRSALDRIAKADRRLFTKEGPRLDAIHQGAAGDCFALAPLGATLARDPKAVTKMMTQTAGGKVRVAFADRSVEVAPLTDGEIAMSGGSTENTGCWLRVYEKALGQYLRENKGDTGQGLAADVISHGGSQAVVMAALTGHAASTASLDKLRDPAVDVAKRSAQLAEVRKRLAAAVAEKRLVGMSTPADLTMPGMTPRHAYAVLGYDAKTDVLTLWNPHGSDFTPQGPPGPSNGYARKDGLFKVPLPELVQWARSLTFETDKPAPPAKK